MEGREGNFETSPKEKGPFLKSVEKEGKIQTLARAGFRRKRRSRLGGKRRWDPDWEEREGSIQVGRGH